MSTPIVVCKGCLLRKKDGKQYYCELTGKDTVRPMCYYDCVNRKAEE